MVGKNPRVVGSGAQPAEFYAAMWRTLTSGETWHGELTNRRKDGTLYRVEATISPVLAEDGTLINYVGIQRDVTCFAASKLEAERETRERVAFVRALERISVDNSLEAGAQAVCEELRSLQSVSHAVIFGFDAEAVIPLGIAAGRRLSRSR